MTKTRFAFRTLATLAIPGLIILGGAEGDERTGGCNFAGDTLESPVQAVTTIVEMPDGSVQAELVIISTEPEDGSVFVDSATNIELRIPSGEIVTLSSAGDGRYVASSDDDPNLEYVAGETYRVTFDLDDADLAGENAGENFVAIVEAPSDDATFEINKMPAFTNDTAEIRWTPFTSRGLLTIEDPTGEVAYTSFDWSHPDFDGSKWGSLLRNGSQTINVDVFELPGTYTFSFCAVKSQEGFDEELSSTLGVASGFMVGQCFEPQEVEVTE